jgi:hypothetical protein
MANLKARHASRQLINSVISSPVAAILQYVYILKNPSSPGLNSSRTRSQKSQRTEPPISSARQNDVRASHGPLSRAVRNGHGETAISI